MITQSLDVQVLNNYQVSTNNNHFENLPTNIAYGYEKYFFNNDLLTLNPETDNFTRIKILPECIIFNMSNNSIETLKEDISKITLKFKINLTTILKIPLNFLWNLKHPRIIGNKLYISFPFDIFFGDINRINSTYYFSLEYNHAEINNITDVSMLCKIAKTNNLNFNDLSNNVVQQVSSLNVKVDLNDQLKESNEFIIRTHNFKGLIKGFFIETEGINELYEIKFYINEHLRINFDEYLIQEKCVKINENMIYIPFNIESLYNTKTLTSYIGSLNINRTNYSFLNLKFLNPKTNVNIYTFNMNHYNQYNYLRYNTYCQHLHEDFNIHSIVPIDYLLHISDASFNQVPYNSQVLYRLITNTDRNECPITQTIIQPNSRYMLCNNCYNELAIIHWFHSITNCPTCRENWHNFNVYINAAEIPHVIENEVTNL